MNCLHKETRIVDSRKRDAVVRRRECIKCGVRWTTYEYSEEEMNAIKKDLRAFRAMKLFLKVNS